MDNLISADKLFSTSVNATLHAESNRCDELSDGPRKICSKPLAYPLEHLLRFFIRQSGE